MGAFASDFEVAHLGRETSSQQAFNQLEFVECEMRQQKVAPHLFTSGTSKSAAFTRVTQQMNHRRGAAFNVSCEVALESCWKLHVYPTGSPGNTGFSSHRASATTRPKPSRIDF